ncbi:ASCH domain-containing protein [Streptomyces sp. NPDC003077]|uniref:ASCH domain-containing protein n=1 Tax=Streptomyces sp. NPDC003077 TaxID=3154443 RepID=UPI0033B83D41
MGTGDIPATHSLNIRAENLALIKSGAKTIEVRVGYPKIRRIAVGDTLWFRCGDVSVATRITGKVEYPDFESLLDNEDNFAIAGETMHRDELLAACRNIYPADKEALGVFALHLRLRLRHTAADQDGDDTPGAGS